MRAQLALLLLLGALPLGGAGCGLFHGGRTVITYDRGTQPFTTVVQKEGTYALYSANDSRPRLTLSLMPGEPIGFKAAATGSVLAVAGSREVPLNSNETYYWKRL